MYLTTKEKNVGENIIKKAKGESGITLIVLLISIFILLVLAVIAIVVHTWDNSLKEKYDYTVSYNYKVLYKLSSTTEESTRYIYYIDLDNKMVGRYLDKYWLRSHTSRDEDQKKINDSTNEKIKSLLQKIDEIEIKEEAEEDTTELIKEHYYVSSKEYTNKKVDYESNKDLILELDNLFR